MIFALRFELAGTLASLHSLSIWRSFLLVELNLDFSVYSILILSLIVNLKAQIHDLWVMDEKLDLIAFGLNFDCREISSCVMKEAET